MTNRLAHELSPYLVQHAENPVDWYPWGPEAIERARAEQKPIFLSIGYSACHWCHVMEHESFDNASIARQMNEHFVCIKVDREERPDLDQIYMAAVQMMTGRGGWPMSVFLTPDLEPIYAGTYFPPASRMGMPGFDQVLAAVADAWRDKKAEIVSRARELTEHLQRATTIAPPVAGSELSRDLVEGAESMMDRIFDYQHGGFGGAPKFPHPMQLRLLLRQWRRHGRDGVLGMVTTTLSKMAAGGIYDHLGGGFHRYSVDERWLVPHFEKMLYDNALLAGCYLEAWQATGQGEYESVVRGTLDYVLREMTSKEGGFYSTQDADSEGVEGKFFVWKPDEVAAVLGPERAKTFCYVYDVSDEGNFEGHSILNLPKTLAQAARILNRDEAELAGELAKDRAALFAVRDRRVHPGTDDKVLVAWNGLMIEAMAAAGAALGEPKYVQAAARAADFVLTQVRDNQGRLLHSWRAGQARFSACLDDYACFANALVTLYEADLDERWITHALEITDQMLERFADSEAGGFFYTATDHEKLIARTKDVQESSVPSGNGMAATVLLRLGRLCDVPRYLEAAEGTLRLAAAMMRDHPTALGQMVLALDDYLGPTHEVVLVASDEAARDRVLRELRPRYWPHKVVAARPAEGHCESLDAAFAGKESGSEAALYVCRDFACDEPAKGDKAIGATIDRWAAKPGQSG